MDNMPEYWDTLKDYVPDWELRNLDQAIKEYNECKSDILELTGKLTVAILKSRWAIEEKGFKNSP